MRIAFILCKKAINRQEEAIFRKKKIGPFIKYLKLSLLLIVLSAVFLLATSNLIIPYQASDYVFTEMDDLPANRVGLVLGTSKFRTNGESNPFYRYRIEAAVNLYKSGKVDYLIVSGDNETPQYNEPKTMLEDLLKEGIPRSKIYLDYAGFRTLDSVIRCREIFGQEQYTIISQKFHNERAVFLARANNIAAVAFNAQQVPVAQSSQTLIREAFARAKVFIDLLIDTNPRYLGEKIVIGEPQGNK